MLLGRIVTYYLSEKDVAEITRRRTNGHDIAVRISEGRWPRGAQAHIGNDVAVGQPYPMLIVREWTDSVVNGQVFLDGTDVLWAASVHTGTNPGNWI